MGRLLERRFPDDVAAAVRVDLDQADIIRYPEGRCLFLDNALAGVAAAVAARAGPPFLHRPSSVVMVVVRVVLAADLDLLVSPPVTTQAAGRVAVGRRDGPPATAQLRRRLGDQLHGPACVGAEQIAPFLAL